jgi:hypothetical protein
MNNIGKNSSLWSPEDVRRYLKGELSAREMHDLELASLDDPFLADALEGLAPVVEGQHFESDLGDLEARLKTRVETPKKKGTFPPALRVAAAIILLLGLGFMAWFLLTGRRQDEFQVVRNTRKAPPVVIDTVTTRSSVDSTAVAVTRPARTRPPHVADKKQAVVEKKEAVESADTSRDVAVAAAPPSPDTRPKAAAMAPAFKSNYVPAPLVFNGRVLDQNNKPLFGAFLYISGLSNSSTTTDQSGNFSFRLRPQDSSRMLNVSLIGYKQASFAITTLDPNAADMSSNIIRLTQLEAGMDEVVVSGYGARRKETRAAVGNGEREGLDSLWTKASPVIGKQAYLLYLETSKKVLALDTTISGKATISFEVGPKGELTDFRIERSLSAPYDAGLIRLVAEGPAWQVNTGKRVRAAVTVSFP